MTEEHFNGIVLPDGNRIPFSEPVSDKVTVNDTKQLTATVDIAAGEYVGAYDGHFYFSDDNGNIHRKRRFSCDECDYITLDRESVIRHKRNLHLSNYEEE